MTAQLIAAIREMGLPAERGLPGETPQVTDLVIRGYFVSMYESSGAKRLTIGLHFNSSEFMTVVEGFQVTVQGLGGQLYFETPPAESNKMPGISVGGSAVPVSGNAAGFMLTSGTKIENEASFRARMDDWARLTTKEIADRFKTTFEKQGWIN